MLKLISFFAIFSSSLHSRFSVTKSLHGENCNQAFIANAMRGQNLAKDREKQIEKNTKNRDLTNRIQERSEEKGEREGERKKKTQ